MRSATCILATALLAGCSLIYDDGDFRGIADATPSDATIADAAPPTDVDPSMLSLTGVVPADLLEGEGSTATGRPIPVVVTGDSIGANAVITVEVPSSDGGPAPTITVGETVVSSDGMMAATTVAIPVIPELADGIPLEVDVVVTQGTVSARTTLTIGGLDELVVAGGTVDPATWKETYSTVTVDQAVHLAGSAPAILTATASIELSAVIDADGQMDGTPGAGGCAGGGGEAPGSCGDGGGGAGTSGILAQGPGGGGGGFGGTGDPGTGGDGTSPAGAGGDPTGNDMLVPLITAAGQAGNRGNGGGGGGDGTLIGTPGNGGGGGGVIALRTGGTITFATGAEVRANGGGGAPGSSNGGGGGGGSGGALLIHAAGGIVNTSGGAVLRASGGASGSSGSGGLGGAGSLGRIRIDSPAAPTGLAVEPVPLRGPLWQSALPTVVRQPRVTGTIVGEPGRSFSIWVGDDEATTATIGGSGSKEVADLPLVAGSNRVCVFATDPESFTPEGSHCYLVVYVP